MILIPLIPAAFAVAFLTYVLCVAVKEARRT